MTDPPVPPQPWRNVQYNLQPIAPLLLQDLRRLVIPYEGQVSLDFVSQIVRFLFCTVRATRNTQTTETVNFRMLALCQQLATWTTDTS